MTQTPPAIAELRKQIDAIDDQLLALLNARSQFVKQVGAIKHQYQDNQTVFIRSAREADMIRRIYADASKGIFPPLAAAQMWRMVICASLSLESALSISAFAPDNTDQLYWLSREYFGPFTPVSKQPTTQAIINEIAQGVTQVGVVPLTTDLWWYDLPATIRVFACVPFILKARTPVTAIAIAKIEPEPTGADNSLLRVTGDKTVLAKLPHHHLLASHHNAHLVEVHGFLTPADCAELTSQHGIENSALTLLGNYATPIYI